MADSETTRVLFRKSRDGQITAVFPDVRESPRAQLFACYAHVGQHGTCDEAWVREDTRPAKPAEYDNLKRELEREPYGYELVVMARIDGSCFE